MRYKKRIVDGELTSLIREKDGAIIPISLENKDYRKALEDTLGVLDNLEEEIINTKTYKTQRQSAYPPIGDQLDIILKQMAYLKQVNQIPSIPEFNALLDECRRIKERYPKE
jgi:hypothetical protein